MAQLIDQPIVSSHDNSAFTVQRRAALLLMLLGVCFLALVGFAPVQAVHNAAHDTRHAASFPCH